MEQQGNRILECFAKYHSVAYDMQGINDRGTDVLLRHYVKEDGNEIARYIAFQIKSYNDLNEKDYLRKIKAQHSESYSAFGNSLDQYYIILCTYTEDHRDKIRQIKASFSTTNNVTVIDPTYALTFLKLSHLRITSVVSSLLRDDDLVYVRAVQLLLDYTPTEIAVILAVVYETLVRKNPELNIDEIGKQNFIVDVFKKVPDYPRNYFFSLDPDVGAKDTGTKKPKDMCRDFEERYTEAIDSLEGVLFNFDGDSCRLIIGFDNVLPVYTIMLEAIVRYGYKEDQLLTYLFDALEILEHYEIETDWE